MDFLVLKDPDQYYKDIIYKRIELIIKDRGNVLFELGVNGISDTIPTWLAILRFLEMEDSKKLDDLLDIIPALLSITTPDSYHDTYFNLLQAIFNWLDQHKDIKDPTHQWYVLYNELEQALFHFKIVSSINKDTYEIVFSCVFEEKLRIQFPSKVFKVSPIPISQALLALAYRERRDDTLYFINNYRHFRLNIAKLDQRTEEGWRIIQTFMSLSKALIILIKQGMADLAIYESLIPEICTFIVCYEPNIEEQKPYLENILGSRANEQAKKEQLAEIVKQIQQSQSPKQARQKGTDETRLIQVIGIISDYYLRRYDFAESDYFWRQVKTNDHTLKFFLSLHKHPLRYLLLLIGLLISLFVIAYLIPLFHWQISTQFPSLFTTHHQLNGAWFLTLLLYFLAYLPPGLILMALCYVVISAIRKSRHWLYSQLLLPRLVGAAMVGLFPIMFNDQSWLIGLRSSFIPWLLLLLLTYIGSFAYMFIAVYKPIKFEKGGSVEEALRTSIRIFCIAACETLIIVTVASMFVFPSIQQLLGNLNASAPGISVALPGLSFNLFPSLILLWGGFALFIGSFVQLLWQDRRITDPI